MDSALVESFLKASGEVDGLMRQFDVTKLGMKKVFLKKRPGRGADWDKTLPESFWNDHKETVKRHYHDLTAEHFTEEELQKILDFFNSEAGKKYISWRALTEKTDSKIYLAGVEMHRQANNISNWLIEQTEG